MANSTRRAAIYCRISQDRGGAGLGVARQEEDCRALSTRKGWDVVSVHTDNDVSAYSGAPRPAWQELLAEVRSGHVDAVVCWHVDRLTRSPRELEDVIDLADQHGIELATVSGEIDLATPTGRRSLACSVPPPVMRRNTRLNGRNGSDGRQPRPGR